MAGDDRAADRADEPFDDALDEDEEVELLDPREAARDRRRDHDAGARSRDLLRPGMGKVFKQITDRIARDAVETRSRRRPRA
jgi:hypothetical protein